MYRDPHAPEPWEKKDPLVRFRNYLKQTGLWTEALETELTEKHNQTVSDAMSRAEKLSPPPVDTLFEEVYEEMPWHIAEQKAWLLQQARTKSPHSH